MTQHVIRTNSIPVTEHILDTTVMDGQMATMLDGTVKIIMKTETIRTTEISKALM